MSLLRQAADLIEQQARQLEEAREALREIVALDDEFRASMIPEADIDPLTEAINRHRTLLAEAGTPT